MSISIVYWSGTGNTEAMANALADGIREAGGEAALITVDSAGAEALASEEVFALGCPSMGAEELEESEMEPFVAELEGKVKGKKITALRVLWLGRRRMDAELGRTDEECRCHSGDGCGHHCQRSSGRRGNRRTESCRKRDGISISSRK